MVHLGRVIERCLLAHHHLAADKVLLQCDVLEVFQYMGFAGAKVARNEDAFCRAALYKSLLGCDELRSKPFLNPRLGTAKAPHSVSIRHASAQGLDGTPTLDLGF